MTEERDQDTIGHRLRGVQHAGLTVQNMDRAFEFYTKILGGTEIMRDGNFEGEDIQNTLFTAEELAASNVHVQPETVGIPDLRQGRQQLDVRFVQFDNLVLELLQYRGAGEPQGNGHSFAPPHMDTSPAYPRSMHLCFYVKEDVDIDEFMSDLERECERRGMSEVRANRTVRTPSEAERKAAPKDANTNKIRQGASNGWSFIYCKGPEGEQLEFVQVRDPVKSVFAEGMARHLEKAARG